MFLKKPPSCRPLYQKNMLRRSCNESRCSADTIKRRKLGRKPHHTKLMTETTEQQGDKADREKHVGLDVKASVEKDEAACEQKEKLDAARSHGILSWTA